MIQVDDLESKQWTPISPEHAGAKKSKLSEPYFSEECDTWSPFVSEIASNKINQKVRAESKKMSNTPINDLHSHIYSPEPAINSEQYSSGGSTE